MVRTKLSNTIAVPISKRENNHGNKDRRCKMIIFGDSHIGGDKPVVYRRI
jgi:hypothetical protein